MNDSSLSSRKEWLRVLAYMKPRIGIYTAGVLGNSLTEAGIFAVMAFVFRDMINAGIEMNKSLLYRAVWTIGITAVSASILLIGFSYLYNWCVRKTMAEIRANTFDEMTRLKMETVERMHSGNFISVMTHDIQTIEQVFAIQIPSMVYAVIYGSSSVILLLMLDWRIGSILLSIGLLFVWFNRLFVQSFRKLGDRIQESQGRMNEYLTDFLGGFSAVKMFHLERKMSGHYKDAIEEVTKLSIARARKQGLIDGINFTLSSLNYAGVLIVCAYMVSRNWIGAGDIGAIVQFAIGIAFMFQQIGGLMTQLQGSLAGASRVFALVDGDKEKDLPEIRNTPMTDKRFMIEMKHASFAYETGRTVINEVSLTALQGERIALVGPSGGGKSTLMKLLMGFYSLDKGEIRIDGVQAESVDQISDKYAYVPQDAYLFQGTIAENIRFGRMDATDKEIMEAARQAYAHDFIMGFPEGYDTVIGERGALLSGGQKQRIAIARAMVKNAPILFLDEATSALDSDSENWIQLSLEKLMEDKTTVSIAHRLSTIRGSDRIYVIDQGRVVEEGRHEQLLQSEGLYSMLNQKQSSSRNSCAKEESA
ncbi:ABC transporter ATP-binding protein [Paenibacillus spiritus]|uniref:ABC transporter ATP-binding protein n=1 Tax=Paenibacillus spiritus TaxID=2496557 RepID=A0A5J5GKN1_9BACL|nr:ABC transporter ATP-binding protein [Paenibacillus spiritus]KAA9008680.1 ABC transporter ATP-binding protein [Paenibacillus spiritus]